MFWTLWLWVKSLFFNDCLGYLVRTCTAISGQFIEALSLSFSPTSGQNFNRKGLIRYVADDSSSNYLILFSTSCASNLPGMAQELSSESEIFGREHFRCSVTRQLPFSCKKNSEKPWRTTWHEEDNREEIQMALSHFLYRSLSELDVLLEW